jgi:hypothetical protein
VIEAIRTLTAWDASSLEERQQVVAAILQRLEPSTRFLGWERHVLGDEAHTTALFAQGMRRLALLPGYIGELGYDPARHHIPARVEDEWMQQPKWLRHTFPDFLARYLTPLRSVTLAPFLIETTAAPLAMLLRQHPSGRGTIVGKGPTHGELLATIRAQGFRYPTDDEWEYACSGGSRAFFRWGDAWPPIPYASLRRRGLDDWREDTLPNAFGLLIGQDPTALEVCMELDQLRGGDGGGWSQFNCPTLEWLGFATSKRSLESPIDGSSTYALRRVVPLEGVV